MDWARLLEECRKSFGEPPRRFGLFGKPYLHIDSPQWMKKRVGDALHDLLEHQQQVFRNGSVVWGQMVQANELLFRPGPHDHPGELCFAADPRSEVDPSFLASVGMATFRLKSESPSDPRLEGLATHLRNEKTRSLGTTLPSSFTGGPECVLVTTLFSRKHLPGGVLLKRSLPVVVLRSQTTEALILPEKYWPAALRQWFVTP